jgi:hypothetical protein
MDRPQRRQFILCEARADADPGIVPSDVVAADKAQQRRCAKREVHSPRLTRQKKPGLTRHVPQEPSEIILLEMV